MVSGEASVGLTIEGVGNVAVGTGAVGIAMVGTTGLATGGASIAVGGTTTASVGLLTEVTVVGVGPGAATWIGPCSGTGCGIGTGAAAAGGMIGLGGALAGRGVTGSSGSISVRPLVQSITKSERYDFINPFSSKIPVDSCPAMIVQATVSVSFIVQLWTYGK